MMFWIEYGAFIGAVLTLGAWHYAGYYNGRYDR